MGMIIESETILNSHASYRAHVLSIMPNGAQASWTMPRDNVQYRITGKGPNWDGIWENKFNHPGNFAGVYMDLDASQCVYQTVRRVTDGKAGVLVSRGTSGGWTNFSSLTNGIAIVPDTSAAGITLQQVGFGKYIHKPFANETSWNGALTDYGTWTEVLRQQTVSQGKDQTTGWFTLPIKPKFNIGGAGRFNGVWTCTNYPGNGDVFRHAVGNGLLAMYIVRESDGMGAYIGGTNAAGNNDGWTFVDKAPGRICMTDTGPANLAGAVEVTGTIEYMQIKKVIKIIDSANSNKPINLRTLKTRTLANGVPSEVINGVTITRVWISQTDNGGQEQGSVYSLDSGTVQCSYYNNRGNPSTAVFLTSELPNMEDGEQIHFVVRSGMHNSWATKFAGSQWGYSEVNVYVRRFNGIMQWKVTGTRDAELHNGAVGYDGSVTVSTWTTMPGSPTKVLKFSYAYGNGNYAQAEMWTEGNRVKFRNEAVPIDHNYRQSSAIYIDYTYLE